MLMAGAEWIDSVNTMRPSWWVRTYTGISMDAGIALLVLSLMRGGRAAARPA